MNKVTLLDGGMGQELLRRSERAITRMWSADIMFNEPAIVTELHRDFILSGASVITLNNYSATPHRLARENELDKLKPLHTLAMQAAADAIEQAQREGIRVAGCLPPLVASYKPEITLTYAESLSSYRELVELQSPGCDLFICETMASISEATAACTAALESGKPVWVALTVSDTNFGKLRSGEAVSEAVAILEALGADAILFNCSQPEAINGAWPQIENSTLPIGAYANGFVSIAALHPGGTVEVLETREDLDPEQYANYVMQWVNNGATIVGGCCEIGPRHIKAIYERLLQQGLLFAPQTKQP
jgi:S-methylmethionine-dependent homocysteine/selenocysteine methylase